MASSSTIRKSYDAIALFALVNVAAAVGLLFWLIGSGTIDREKAIQIATIFRGDSESTEETGADLPAEPEEVAPSRPVGLPSVAASQAEMEIVRREADRTKEELRQRLALNNSILLRVTAEREAFKNERESAKNQERAGKAYRETEGFAKQVAIYNSLKPKVAVQHLLGLEDADESARILLAMTTRQAKKIIEAAKRGEQSKKMMTILQRLREVSPGRSAELMDE